MAMFDLKDSENITATRCTTTSETLIKGEGLKRVVADDCHAGKGSNPSPPSEDSLFVRIRLLVVENSIKTIFSTVGAVLVAAALAYWNLKK